MDFFAPTASLTHHGAMTMLQAGIAMAQALDQPQCLVIVDGSGEIIAELRMTGAKFLSRRSARSKALTAASIRAPSHTVPEHVRSSISSATGGTMTGLPGGLPIMAEGTCVGGVGVGSGSGDQDIAVANAMLAAVGAPTFE